MLYVCLHHLGALVHRSGDRSESAEMWAVASVKVEGVSQKLERM